MIFKDILNEKYQKLIPEFDRLLRACYENQTHPGDLLLVHQNGFYNAEIHKWNNISETLSPYCMGPDNELHSENTHFKFIEQYVNGNLSERSFADYSELIKHDITNFKNLEVLTNTESYGIQIEMLIYLKIWESDTFIKSFYQLARLLLGEHYDWHFKITEKQQNSNSTGTRGNIIRDQIKDKLMSFSPILYNSFDNSYKSQIRNAIAHSQYITIGRTITLNNFDKENKYNLLPSISFDKWTDIFHETIALHSLYNKMLANVLEIYGRIALRNNNCFEVRINREDPFVSTVYRRIQFDPRTGYWR